MGYGGRRVPGKRSVRRRRLQFGQGLAGQRFRARRDPFLVDQDCHKVTKLRDLIANAAGRRMEDERVELHPLIVNAVEFDVVDRQVNQGGEQAIGLVAEVKDGRVHTFLNPVQRKPTADEVKAINDRLSEYEKSLEAAKPETVSATVGGAPLEPSTERRPEN